ncbi:MAG: hypothetical protein IJH34_07535 [Romboutsia sp.]|nr:hypothetical protein [Romboutsia sp.]
MKSKVDEKQRKEEIKKSKKKLKGIIKFINERIYQKSKEGQTTFFIERCRYSIPYLEECEIIELLNHYKGLGYYADFGNCGEFIRIGWEKSYE